jgi:hypothetical protein
MHNSKYLHKGKLIDLASVSVHRSGTNNHRQEPSWTKKVCVTANSLEYEQRVFSGHSLCLPKLIVKHSPPGASNEEIN